MIHKTYLLGAVLLLAGPAAADAHGWRTPHRGVVVQEIGAVEVAPNVYVLDDLTPYPYIGPRAHRHHYRRHAHRPARHHCWCEPNHKRRW